MTSKKAKEVIIKYKFDQNYNPQYANGAYGGMFETGEVVINFYTERLPIPNEQVINLDDPTLQPKTVSPENYNESRVRFVHSGVIMTYPHAKELHRWLGEHLKDIEKALKVNTSK